MSPHKIWAVGEEVLAADFNTYVQEQVLSTFPTAAARNAAITSPHEGQVTWLNDTNRLEVYNGTAWQLFILPPYTLAFGYEPLTASFVSGGETTFETPAYNYRMLVEAGWWTFHAVGSGTTVRITDVAGNILSPADVNVLGVGESFTYNTGSAQFLTGVRTAGTAASLRVLCGAFVSSGGGIRFGLAKVSIIQV